jgi:hypothetical protein
MSNVIDLIFLLSLTTLLSTVGIGGLSSLYLLQDEIDLLKDH